MSKKSLHVSLRQFTGKRHAYIHCKNLSKYYTMLLPKPYAIKEDPNMCKQIFAMNAYKQKRKHVSRHLRIF